MGYCINGYVFHPEGSSSFGISNMYHHVAIDCVIDLERLISNMNTSENIKRVEISDELQLRRNTHRCLNTTLQNKLWELYRYDCTRPITALFRVEDNNLVFRCFYDDSEDGSGYNLPCTQIIDPMIIPITIESYDNERMEVCYSGADKWDVYLNPGEVTFLENTPAIRFMHEGKVRTIAYDVVEQYTETVIEIKPDKSRENERKLPWTDRNS